MFQKGRKASIWFRQFWKKRIENGWKKSFKKTIKESVRELGICGTTEQSTTKLSLEEIPDQIDGFSISNGKICKGGEAYDCTIHTLLDLLG